MASLFTRMVYKLFMGDTGLLCAACMENVQFGLFVIQNGLNVDLLEVTSGIIPGT